MSHWSVDSVFYHIYPLGLSGAPQSNDFCSPPSSRLKEIMSWIPQIKNLGANALYIGPLFESTSHGYDTVDYFNLDRRLGNNADLKEFVKACHVDGIRVVFDAVFNHVGRDHFAFRDLCCNGWESPYRDWFFTNFDKRSKYGDKFWYEGWNNHFSLVKLNLNNEAARKHIFDAVSYWITEFGADGIRLDAADCIDKNFFCQLRTFCKSKQSEFWLMGELIHGDYNEYVNPERLDSATNYELYKGLWSSHNDGNFFEIAHSANRQFGKQGIYEGLNLYIFADNHDVDRVASLLKDPAYLYSLYVLLFTLPGIPSIYYGSEFGIEGKKSCGSDVGIRPALDLESCAESGTAKDLFRTIQALIALRKKLESLRNGSYVPLYVSSRQFAFMRETAAETAIVVVNSAKENHLMELPVPFSDGYEFTDVLNGEEKFYVNSGKLKISLCPCWGKVLVPRLRSGTGIGHSRQA